MERNSQETERIIAEAKQEKIRYLDEAHAANRKVTELQTRLKLVENRLAEKEAMIRAYQGQKSKLSWGVMWAIVSMYCSLAVYGSTNSYGSYNLSSDSFALNSLGAYNSQASYDVSNNSFDVTTTASLLDTTGYCPNVSSSFTSNYGQTNPSFNQSSINLQTAGGNSYSSPSSSSNYSTNYGTSDHTNIYDSKNFDAQRKSIDDQLKQLDEQLLSKVSELMVEKQSNLLLKARAAAVAAANKGSTNSVAASSRASASGATSSSSSVDSNGNLLTDHCVLANSCASNNSASSSKVSSERKPMSKTISTPAINAAVGAAPNVPKLPKKATSVSSVKKLIASSCKNISSPSSSSEQETFY